MATTEEAEAVYPDMRKKMVLISFSMMLGVASADGGRAGHLKRLHVEVC